MQSRLRLPIATIAAVVALWGVGHAAAMSSGGSLMHDGMPSTAGVLLACALVVGAAALALLGVAPAPDRYGLAVESAPPIPPGRRGDVFSPPARASPAWLQQFRR